MASAKGGVWDEFRQMMAPHFRTYALDFRGHDRSDWEPNGVHDFASHLEGLLVAIVKLPLRSLVLSVTRSAENWPWPWRKPWVRKSSDW